MCQTLHEPGPHNPWCQSKPIIWQHMASWQTKSYLRPQRQWICIFIGCAIKNNKNSFDFTGNQEKQTMLTIGSGTMLLHSTNECAHCFSTNNEKQTGNNNKGGHGGADRERPLTSNWKTGHVSRPDQLQECAGISEIPNPNNGQWSDMPRGKSRKT